MSDLVTPPVFGPKVYTPQEILSSLGVEQRFVVTRTFRRVVNSAQAGPFEPVTGVDVDVAETYLFTYEAQYPGFDDSALVMALNKAQDALATALASLTSAQTQEKTARTLYENALEAYSAATVGVYAAQAEVDVLTRRGAAPEVIAQAQSNLVAANQTAAAALAAATQDTPATPDNPAVLSPESKWNAAVVAVGVAQSAVGAARVEVVYRQGIVDAAPLKYQRAKETYDNQFEANPVDSHGNYTGPFVPFASIGQGNGSNQINPGGEPESDPYMPGFPQGAVLSGAGLDAVVGPGGSPTILYRGSNVGTTYQQVVTIPAEMYAPLVALGRTLRLRWQEGTLTFAINAVEHQPEPGDSRTYTVNQIAPLPDGAPVLSPMEEGFDPGDATQDYEGGPWSIVGAAHDAAPPDVPAPDSGSVKLVCLFGLNACPQTAASVQFRGGERVAQGWRAFQSAPGGLHTPRYLSMTASAGPGTPTGKNYGGSLRFAPVDGSAGDEPDYIDLGSDPLRAPLVVYSTLTDDVTGGDPLNFPFVDMDPAVESDDATLVNATQRIMQAPPGLIWTLSDEQTPASLAVAAAADAAKPWQDAADAPVPPAIDGLGAAILYQAPDGNYAAEQNLRYLLSYDARATVQDPTTQGFTATFRWALKRRNLLTGEVTMEGQSRDIAFPIEEDHGSDPKTYRYTDADTDWTEVSASVNEIVELVTLPGALDPAYGFQSSGGNLGNYDPTNPNLPPPALNFADVDTGDDGGGVTGV